MNKIVFSIQYAGMQLPVFKNAAGQNITPLKPISDLLGLVWRTQRKKVVESAFLTRRLGCSGMDVLTSNGDSGEPRLTSSARNPAYLDEVFIRIDRVAAYLMTINPDQVRAQGNGAGADFLEQKIEEWDDAIHDYEELGMAIKRNHRGGQTELIGLFKARTLAVTPQERDAVTRLIAMAFAGLGQPLAAPAQKELSL